MQLINTPIDRMTIEELKQEREVHRWQANKSKRGAENLERRLYWLEENEPIQTKEEINRAYEDGELTKGQYQTAFARRAKSIGDRKRTERKIDYSRRLEAEERALVGIIDERILQLEATKKRSLGRPPKRDPRKRQVKKQTYKRPRNLTSIKEKWRIIDRGNKINAQMRASLAPLPSWNLDTLKLIAFDRGFFTEEGFIYHLSQELELSYMETAKALKSGKFTFGQVLLIGSYLEMTPKEFCDTCLRDYFKGDYGNYKAEVTDKRALLTKPIKGDIKA